MSFDSKTERHLTANQIRECHLTTNGALPLTLCLIFCRTGPRFASFAGVAGPGLWVPGSMGTGWHTLGAAWAEPGGELRASLNQHVSSLLACTGTLLAASCMGAKPVGIRLQAKSHLHRALVSLRPLVWSMVWYILQMKPAIISACCTPCMKLCIAEKVSPVCVRSFQKKKNLKNPSPLHVRTQDPCNKAAWRSLLLLVFTQDASSLLSTAEMWQGLLLQSSGSQQEPAEV